jgi:hypothetical protein
MTAKMLDRIFRRGRREEVTGELERREKPYRLVRNPDPRFMKLPEIDAAELREISGKLWEQTPADYIARVIRQDVGRGSKIAVQSCMNEAIKNAIEPYVKDMGCNIIEVDPNSVEFKPKNFRIDDPNIDMIISWGVIRSFPESSLRLKEYGRVLRSGGYVMGIVPSFEVLLREKGGGRTKVGKINNSYLSEMLEYLGFENQLISFRSYNNRNNYFFIARKK